MQLIYQLISVCFEDDCADELTNEPIMIVVMDKNVLVSKLTLSRFFNRMDEDTLLCYDGLTGDLLKAELRGEGNLVFTRRVVEGN